MAKSKSAAKVNKKSVVVNINPEFMLSHDDCLRRKIIPVLSDLKVKDWTNLVLLVDNAINHETLQVSVESVMRHILNFFSEVTKPFYENVELSKYTFSPVPGPSISPTLPLVPELSNIDNIFTCENESESIGRRIKEEAVKLHDDYIKGYDMSAESKFIMDMGLSSTLDLINKLDNYQSYLFSEKEFECLYEYFYSKYKSRKELSTPVLVSEKWNMVVDLATKKVPFITLKYISKIQSLDSTSETLYAYLEIFKHVVNIFYEDSGIIDSVINGRLSVSEQDVYDIWFPIIKKLQFRYSDQVRVKGFKIDVRLLLDYERKEIDLCSGEVAIDANDADKLTHDRSKYIREAKEILDHHVEAGMGENAIGWIIQFAGLEARLMSVRLFKEGLYVAISQKEMTFPQSLGELNDFTDTLNSLEYLVACNESEAVELVGLFNQVTRVHSVSLNSDNVSRNNKYRMDLLTRPTYYTPPSGKRADPEVPELDRRGPEDLFGWCELMNGNWYNSVTGVTYEASPYQ
ncbi:hypothetical protein HPULCUR_010673 [Helicostylum pulchrum]|uniref:Uncharacterized protein n=1 Tax=Helicostylum pulchrum TaxID=562976 RepID=A0ABP9YEU0_9FUNG